MIRGVGDNLPNGVVFQAHDAPDGTRTITHVSAGCEALFGFTPEEVRANPILYYERMLEEGRPHVMETEAAPIRDRTVYDIEFRISAGDAAVKWLHGRAMPRPLPDSRTVWEGIFLDVSQRKREEEGILRARDEADRANQAKSEFLSRMSYEMHTPLNSVLGFAQLLEMSGPTTPQRRHIDQNLKGVRHLLTLINEVLDLTSIEVGRMELSFEPISVYNLFQEVLDLIRPLAERRAIRLRICPECGPAAQVRADNQWLKQVLLNLVSNAVKYNAERGSVELSCQAEDPASLRLKATDDGLGIPEAKFDRLFTPFDRLGAEATTVEGSGLGLVLRKRLVEVMGGKLDFASRPGDDLLGRAGPCRGRAVVRRCGDWRFGRPRDFAGATTFYNPPCRG